MGVCCSKQKERENGIRQQIEQTVVEQQKLKEEEEQEQEQIQIQCYSSGRKSQTYQFNPAEICNLVTQVGNDDAPIEIGQIQQEKIKKKKPEDQKDDTNYLRKLEHILSLKSIVVQLQQEGDMQYYKISILINFKDLLYNVNLNGTLTTQLDFKYFTLRPNKFEEAYKYSRFLTFFSNDNYFNIEKECINSFNSFDKLLYVERCQQEVQSNMKKLQKKGQKAETCLVNSINQEMLEIITIVDVEQQSRFLTVLFHLLIQKYLKKLEFYLVFITNATFLFEILPQFDQPSVYRLALFYDKLDYSLKDLQILCLKNKMELSKILYQKFALNLIEIFYQCYSNYIYRLNLTLSTIFYVSKLKTFKVQTFGRLKYLLQFGCNIEDALKQIDEKKMKLFQKAFKKDLFALCDLLVYFKNINKISLKQIQSQRKKYIQSISKGQYIDDDNNYLIYVDQIFSSKSDRYVLEFIHMTLYSNEIKSTDKILEDTLPILQQLQKIITDYESQLDGENNKINNNNYDFQIQENSLDTSKRQIDQDDSLYLEDYHNCLKSFQFDFNSQYQELSINKDKLTETQLIYQELIYQSLLFQDQFQFYYQKFKQCEKLKQEEVHVEILNAFYLLKSMNDDSWEYKLNIISQMMDKPVQIMNSIYETSIDHFHITIMFQILTLSQRKPLPLLNQFYQSINKQLEIKVKIDKKLKQHNSSKGIIEQKKYIMIELMYAQSYLKNNNFYQAVHKIQKVIGFQLKNQNEASLFYAYSLLISGEIQKESLQPVSAMLNLEMSQVIYDGYFPEFITVEDTQEQLENNKTIQKFQYLNIQNLATNNKAKLEFLLGISYFEVHDQENSLKCLKFAEKLLLRSFDIYSDEVVVVVLKQLQLYVLQDDIGSAYKITLQYARKMNQYYQEGKTFKRKIISKLQFIMGHIFEFNGQYLNALRYIERSNRTFTNSKSNNFIIQMHFQAKKSSIIQKIKTSFIRIKNRQELKNPNDLSLFQTLNEHMSSTFLTQFYKQRFIQKSSLLLDKYEQSLIMVQQLQRLKLNDEALKFLKKTIKILNKTKKDELYAILSSYLTYIRIQSCKNKKHQQLKLLINQIEINQRYFIFPIKEYHLLKCFIYLIIFYIKMNQTNQIQEIDAKIQLIIDEFYLNLQWKTISDNCYKNTPNKFDLFIKKGKITLLYQISAIIEVIEYYNHLKKQIFDAMFNGKDLIELYQTIRTQFEKFINEINNQLFMKKQNCLFGTYSQIIIKNNTNQDEKKDVIQENKLITSCHEKQNNQIQDDQKKIVFDLRSYQEIIISKKYSNRISKLKQISKIELQQSNYSQDNISTKNEKQKSTNNNYYLQSNDLKQSNKLNPFNSTMKKTQKSFS